MHKTTVSLFCVLQLAFLTLCGIACLYWRHVWFFRNPTRKTPSECSGILSPADGSIVCVKEVAPGEEIITIKQGVKATIDDICREANLKGRENRNRQTRSGRKQSKDRAFHARGFSALNG
ncbi:MAG: phosphatidylserine decarboxylase [Syntrophobacteraceae bacterium]